MDNSDSEEWDDSEEQELNDKEYTNLEARIALLEQLEDITVEYIKTSSLYVMKLKETYDERWLDKIDILSKDFNAASKVYHDMYIALGGPDLSAGS